MNKNNKDNKTKLYDKAQCMLFYKQAVELHEQGYNIVKLLNAYNEEIKRRGEDMACKFSFGTNSRAYNPITCRVELSELVIKYNKKFIDRMSKLHETQDLLTNIIKELYDEYIKEVCK